MADHSELPFARSSAMNIAVATPHWASAGSEIGAGNIDERLPKGRSTSLITNQRCKNVALPQKHAARNAHCLLAFADIDAAGDHPAAVHAREFLLQSTGKKHPPERLQVTVVHYRFCLLLLGR